MKHSKPTNSATNSSPRPPREISTRAQLRELQRVMAVALFRPLTPQWGMQKHWTDGKRMHDLAAEFIKPTMTTIQVCVRWPCQAASYSRRHPRYPTVEAAFRFAALSFVARAGLRCR